MGESAHIKSSIFINILKCLEHFKYRAKHLNHKVFMVGICNDSDAVKYSVQITGTEVLEMFFLLEMCWYMVQKIMSGDGYVY